MELKARELTTSEKLYRYMERRMGETGAEMPCSQTVLSLYAAAPRADLDYLQLINLNNRDLFDACYILSFNVMPPADYFERWKEDIETLPKEEFHKKFINSFVYIRDYGKFFVRMRNCVYMQNPVKIRSGSLMKWREKLYHGLKPLYMKLPKKTRNRLKDRLWKYFFTR